MIEFKLPSLGADMDKGTLLEWRVQVGDTVRKGDVVAVVDTTKAAIDVESWQEGTVHELLLQPGATVPVGTPMAILLQPGDTPEQIAAFKAQLASAQLEAAAVPPAATVTVVPASGSPAPEPSRHASPAARKRAHELGIDIASVRGTGPRGAITIADVEEAAATAAARPVGRGVQMRRTIAAAMARSKREIPHYYLSEQMNLAAALEWLKAENERRAVTERLLIAALYLKAVALAARKHPRMNGYYINGEFKPAASVNVGVAISLREGGLIAPAIHDVDGISLHEVMHALSDLVTRARAGSLRSSEIAEPTLTVTNLGEQSVDAVYGIIYPPQVALVGFGRIRERATVVNGEVRAVPAVTVSLSADHRASDGHDGALFLAEVRELLQHPEKL